MWGPTYDSLVMSSCSLIFIRRQELHLGNCNSDTESTSLHFLEVPCPPGQCSPSSFPPHSRILLGGRLFHHLSPLLSLYDSVSHHCPPPAHSSFYGGRRNMYTHTHIMETSSPSLCKLSRLFCLLSTREQNLFETIS